MKPNYSIKGQTGKTAAIFAVVAVEEPNPDCKCAYKKIEVTFPLQRG